MVIVDSVQDAIQIGLKVNIQTLIFSGIINYIVRKSSPTGQMNLDNNDPRPENHKGWKTSHRCKE